jgi:hypothetical protein
MAAKRKILAYAAAGLVALAALAVFALTRDYDSPELGRALLRQVSSRGDLELEAEGFRLSPLHGLRLQNVRVASKIEGGRLEATAERLVLEHRLGPLLRGQILVEQIVLERPEVELVSYDTAASGEGGDSPPPAAGGETEEEETGRSKLSLRVERFAIVDGTLVTRVEGTDEPPTEVRGLDLELRDIASDPAAPSLVQGLSARGELEADEAVAAEILATGVTAQIELADGHLRLRDCAFPTELGRFLIQLLDVDLNRDPYTFQLDLVGDPVRTHEILGGNAEGGFGAGKLDLSLAGDLSEDLHLKGPGSLAVTTGKLPSNAAFEALEKLLGIPLVGQEYQPFEVPFKIARNRLVAEGFRLAAGQLELAASGWVGLLDESLSLQLSASALREAIDVKEIPKEVLEALTDSEGRVHLPILITGSQGSPAVKFDRSTWGQIVRQRVRGEAEKELGKALGRLFGKKED